MANIDDGGALPVMRRKDSKLRNWDQFFSMFQKQVRKPTAELLARVDTIGK